MGAANFQADLYQLRQSGDAAILNPGAGGTFDLRGRDLATVTLTATGTYTLPNSPVGTQLLVCCDDTSTITLADAGGTFHIFTGTSGTTSVLCVATDSNSWSATRLTHQDSNGALNASQVAYDDDDSQTTFGNVEAALDEIYNHLQYATGWSTGPALSSFREVDTSGDVRAAADAAAAGSGGVLASDTTPIFLGDAAEALAIQWAASNSDIIATTVNLPANLDGAAPVTVELLVQASGVTNAPSFSVLTNFDGAAQVTDTATGTASASKQTIIASIDAADVPASAMVMSMQLVPGTHAADSWTLYGVRVNGRVTLFQV